MQNNKTTIISVLIFLAILIAYFVSGQFSNIRDKVKNKVNVDLTLSLHNATQSKDSFKVFFKGICKAFKRSNFDDGIQLIIRNKARASLSFVECNYDFQNIKLTTEAIMTNNGFVIDGTKITKGSKVQLQNKGSTFIAYVQNITTNAKL